MKFIRFLISLTLSLFIFGYCHGEEDIDIRLAQTASGRGREYVTELSDGWKFGGKDEDAYINGSFIGDMASAGNGVFITEGQKPHWGKHDPRFGQVWRRTV